MRACECPVQRIHAVILGFFLATVPAMQALELHVSPEGDDAWSGKSDRPNSTHNDGPLATLVGARDAIRKLKQQGPLTEPVKVVVAEGRYPLSAPLELDPEDGGTAQAPVSYESARGAHPIFSGGRVIRDWKPGTNGIWQTQLPKWPRGNGILSSFG